MKKVFALLLSMALLCETALPALAVTSDVRLIQVTQAVKDTLDLDTAVYTDFYGVCQEDTLAPVWDLTWTGDSGSLTIESLEDGTILYYMLSEYRQVPEPIANSPLPSFPEENDGAASAAAQTFVDKVLRGESESAKVSLIRSPGLDGGDYRFTADILLNGLPSPLSLSLTVRAKDHIVTQFSRDVPDNACLGGIPSPIPIATQAQSSALFRNTQALRLEYVRTDDDPTYAILRYLPEYGHDFYVDASTGKLVDLTELEGAMYKGTGAGNSDTAAEAPAAAEENGSSLTEAEQAGIQKLEGVQSKEALDAGLRSVKEYGLTAYTLVSAAYSIWEGKDDGEEDSVTCTLRYSRFAEDGAWSRTFIVDAKSGVVSRLYSQGPWNEEWEAALTAEKAQSKAESFLAAYYPGHSGHLDLYDSSTDRVAEGSPFYSFTFARQENGYFFPDHFYTVGIDATDGTVSELSFLYEEDVTFDDPDSIVAADAALNIWMSTYDVTLGYLYVPEPLVSGDDAQDKLLQLGFQSFYHLKLGYTLERADRCLGVDAKTGEPVFPPEPGPEGLTYTDLGNHWAREAVETLAKYDVGYASDTFGPDQPLTQWDLLCLLYSLDYSPLDPASEDQDLREEVYAAAYRAGILTKAERSDSALLNRGTVIQMLLDRAGYGKVAQLKGIFTCSYADRDAIPEGELGYAALAQGLGLAGDTYAGQRTATRAEAAVLLYRLMQGQ